MSGAGRTYGSSRLAVGARPSTRREWGWHRLEPEWAERVVDQAGLRPGQLILEFGAGTGALTGPMLDRGVNVIAVEFHPGRAERLRRRFGGDRLTVLELDARDVRLPRRPFRVLSSPPYGITAELVSLITARASRMTRADLVLQRAAVNRYLSRAPKRYATSRGLVVPRRAFAPPPRVDSAVLTLRRT